MNDDNFTRIAGGILLMFLMALWWLRGYYKDKDD